jgi:glucose/arabinose dehydrogenase
VNLLLDSDKKFPAEYRGGAFIVLHGTRSKDDQTSATPGQAKYRPMGEAVGPDGALYLADSQKGRVWRIADGE